MSSPYSDSTSIAEVVIVPNGNKHFEEKLIEVVSLSGNVLTPVRQRLWTKDSEENISGASALITLSNHFVARYDAEDIAQLLSIKISLMLGRMTSSLLETQTILMCDKDNDDIITTFCFANKIKKITFSHEDSENGGEYAICQWSKHRYTFLSKYRKPERLPM